LNTVEKGNCASAFAAITAAKNKTPMIFPIS
jgi:hypothetical protein